eukprot:Clim_evm19s150 gene=Clim_evmTU19s150
MHNQLEFLCLVLVSLGTVINGLAAPPQGFTELDLELNTLSYSETNESGKDNHNVRNKLFAGPIIGIMTEPTISPYDDKGDQYIAGPTVKWIEAAGGRVVPIPYDAPEDHLQFLLERINGLVFPGGAGEPVPNTPWYETGLIILNKVKEYHAKGKAFPVFGICLGFELLVNVSAQQNVLGNTNATDINLPLHFVKNYRSSRLFQDAPASVIETFALRSVTNNNHMYGLHLDHFEATPALNNFWNLISTSTDLNNQPFVSTIESDEYPIWAVQWHPEKPQFEWKPWGNIAHDTDTIAASQWLANFFIGEARKNDSHFDSVKQLNKYLIYNYPASFYGRTDPVFEQVYVFNRHDLIHPTCLTC